MARVPMVTRTITATKAIVMCINIEREEPSNVIITVPRTYKDEESLLKKIKPMLESDTLKVVHIVSTEQVKTLYGMTEQDFMERAKVLPPRNASVDETDNDREQN